MHFEARIEPLNGKLPKVTYRWDPETDILTVACKGVPKGNRDERNGGSRGRGRLFCRDRRCRAGRCAASTSFTWPDDVRTVARSSRRRHRKKARLRSPVAVPNPASQPSRSITSLTVDKNQSESVFHIRVGRQRPGTVVRVADHMLVEVDKQSRIAGLWLLEVPPFPNVEATA